MNIWNDIVDEPPSGNHSRPPHSGEGGHSYIYAQEDHEVERIIQALWAKKLIIIFIIALFTIAGIFYARGLQAQYTTSAVLAVQSDELLPDAVTRVLGLRQGNFEINTHIEVMRSPPMLNMLIEDLNLQDDPEFMPQFENPSVYSETQKKLILMENVRSAITIRPASSASIIRIEVRSRDSVKAAAIANRLADIFIKESLNLKLQEVQRVTDWMETKKNEMEDRVARDARALRDFQTESGIIGNNILQFHNQEFLQLNARLLEAEQDAAEAKTRLKNLRANANKGSGIFGMEQILSSPVIANLKSQETAQQADLAQLATKFGEKHPEYISAKADLQSIRSDLHREVRNIIQNIENDVAVNEARVLDLKERIADFQNEFKEKRNQQLIKLQELQLAVEASRKQFENFLVIYQQAAPQSIVNDSNIKVISYAQPPIYSSYPNRKMIVILAMMVGGFIGIFAALVLDKLNTNFRSIDEIEVFTGFPIYSVVPEVKPLKNSPVSRYVLDKPTSKAAESMRSLRMNLTLRAHASDTIQIINFTSTHSNEGKSTNSVWFASMSAKAGERTLIIDCDMRRPRIHKSLNLNVNKSLVDYLTDRASLTEIIQHDESSGLDVIPCKPTPTHALSLLTSAKMQAMLDELRDEYDLIVLDSPAAATLSDPYVLAKLSDRTLFVIDSAHTDRNSMAASLKKFYDIHYYDLGLVVNRVDFKKAGLEVKGHLSYAYLDDDKSFA